MDKVINEEIRRLLGRSGKLTVVARLTGIPVGTLSDIMRGKAGRRTLRRVRRTLGLIPIRAMAADNLAWRIRNRVEVVCE